MLDPKKFNAQDIVAVTESGEIDPTVTIYDLSLTRNVVQMIFRSNLVNIVCRL